MSAAFRPLLVTLLSAAICSCGSEATAPNPAPQAPAMSVRAFSSPYTQVDLGTLGGGLFSDATDINDLGVIVGIGDVAGGAMHAWMKAGASGPMIDLGVPAGDLNNVAFGINNSGVIVGYSYAGPGSPRHAWRWTATSGFEFLGDLGGGAGSQAFRINERGWITGSTTTAAGFGFDHAFIWTPNSGMQDLGTLPGGTTSHGQDINEEGIVVGFGDIGSGIFHSFRWNKHTGMEDLAPNSGGESGALAINNSTPHHREQVAGFSVGAMWWTRTTHMRSMGGLENYFNSQAAGINDNQVVVGVSDGGQIGFHAWYAKIGQSPIDLTPDPNASSAANRINRCGQIVGNAADTLFNNRATLWDRPCN
jgi:probable HAF family extracellular repeat protein